MAFGVLSNFDVNRRTIPAPANPADKSTIFSIYPKPIHESKISLMPGEFLIPAGSYTNPGRLVIGSCSWWKDVGEDQPLLEIPQSSIVVADAIVKDYCQGLPAFGNDATMGLFFIPGEITIIELKTKHKDRLDKAVLMQKNWYTALVKMADVGYSRTNGNPLAINDDMRLAASELGLEKDWISDIRNYDLVKCPACGHLRNPEYPVCSNCKMIIDIEKARAMGIHAQATK